MFNFYNNKGSTIYSLWQWQLFNQDLSSPLSHELHRGRVISVYTTLYVRDRGFSSLHWACAKKFFLKRRERKKDDGGKEAETGRERQKEGWEGGKEKWRRWKEGKGGRGKGKKETKDGSVEYHLENMDCVFWGPLPYKYLCWNTCMCVTPRRKWGGDSGL